MRLPLLLTALALAASPAIAASRDYRVPGFDRVSTSVPFDVRVRTGAAPSVHATAPQDILDRLQVEVRGGELVISMRERSGWFSGWNWRGGKGVIEVGVPMLQAARLRGPGDLTVDRVRGPRFEATLSGPGNLSVGTLDTRQLDATLNGPGNISLAGRAETANLVLRGPGDIRAAGLTSREATVSLSGPGNLAATVTGLARGTLTGPGDITIRGGARCDISRRGPGEVHCR